MIKTERKAEKEEYAKIGFGIVLLFILVIGVFRPAILSGIPLLFFVTHLGGIHIFAGFTALLVAVAANVLYIFWWIYGFISGRDEEEFRTPPDS